ncbi:MAG: enoyl-CoA hydratase [Proteobacteria bacterium]|nr:enoyl-CoA hydratase [Pseudomonadota bacterium]MDA1059679.1 enoyl-CoA hydratase [Pseudomonadota bacterium]
MTSNSSAAPHTAPLVLRDENAGIVTLTLNRPGARNSLSQALMTELQRNLDDIAASPARVVILAGAGPAFCAGHDLKEIRSDPRAQTYEALFAQCSRLMQTLIGLPQPVIAQVHGPASAAGCQLVATCDLAIAGAAARFATPGVNIGLFCSTPMVALSRNVANKHAMEMLLTGEMIDADAAARIGLVNRVVPDDDLAAAVNIMARRIAEKSRVTVRIGKQAFYRQREMNLPDAYDYASRVMTENMLTHDAEEGIDAFIEKRDPVWKDS